MTISDIRKKYLDFFKANGHRILPSASLIPENDPSVLFTTAGMHPLAPFLSGEKHPAGRRLASCQKCLRTGDIDEVGDNHHLTFFEMLGNWSLGDYWKKEAINLSWEFLTDRKWLNLSAENMAVSVFAGDNDCPFDQESFDAWRALGVKEDRIARLGKSDNWWPAGGQSSGPQGPDTEMFYWTGQGPAPEKFDPKDQRWFEIWNDVFMEYYRTPSGQYQFLKQKNVDTGLGLERTAVALQGRQSVYETENLKELMTCIKSVARDYQEKSGRIIADHLRAAIFILADDAGIAPSNLDQGYVARKLIRRAIRHAKKIGIPLAVAITTPLVEIVVRQFKDIYPELLKNQQRVIAGLNLEEDSFERTLEKGLKEFKKMSADKIISGSQAFDLYSTYGFPLEMTEELAKEHNVAVDKTGFAEEMHQHQQLSRTATVGKFKGGLAEHSEQVIKYHTATHLLHQALRQVLGSHVRQKGSNITQQRLRFDFSHNQKMTEAEKRQVEELINQKIKADLPVIFKEMPLEQAKKSGAIGLFGDKYGDQVKVYTIDDFSMEICGGPHVASTGVLGRFKVIKEEACSSGVRRIKAVLE